MMKFTLHLWWHTPSALVYSRPLRWQCPNTHPLGWQRCIRRPFHFGGCQT